MNEQDAALERAAIGNGNSNAGGLTKREVFAAQFMAAQMSQIDNTNGGYHDYVRLANVAVNSANILLLALKRAEIANIERRKGASRD